MEERANASELRTLFEPSNIGRGRSIDMLRQWGKIEGLQRKLSTNYKEGISDDPRDHQARISRYGHNHFQEKTLWQYYRENMSRMKVFEWMMCLYSMIWGILLPGGLMWEIGVIFLGMNIIRMMNSTKTFLKRRYFYRLRNSLRPKVHLNAVRGGAKCKILGEDLLVGDVVEVQEGMALPVDAILIEGSLRVVEENEKPKDVPQTYQPDEGRCPFLMSRSFVLEGRGQMVVAAVGTNCSEGRRREVTEQESLPTDLEFKLILLLRKIQKLVQYSSICLAVALLVNYIYACANTNLFSELFSFQTMYQVHIAFTILLSTQMLRQNNIAEFVSFSWTFKFSRMKKDNIFVKGLQEYQMLGLITNICTSYDMAGFLTENRLVVKAYIEDKIINSVDEQTWKEETKRMLGLAITNNSTVEPNITCGDKTECALLEMAFAIGYDYHDWRDKERQKKVFPFSEDRQRMSTVYTDHHGNDYAFVKGTPEAMIPHCTHFLDAHGTVTPISEQFRSTLSQHVANFTQEQLHTLLLGFKEVGSIPDQPHQLERGLTMIGLMGMKDPIRAGVREAVGKCREAGVQVRMATNDSSSIAISMAKQAGILEDGWEDSEGQRCVLSGQEFRELMQEPEQSDMQNFRQIARQLRVLNECSQVDKSMLFLRLKQLGEVVALTSRFVILISTLGKQYLVEVLDDSLCSVVQGIKWGRNLFQCMRNIVQFYLTTVLVTFIMTFVGTVFLKESPLHPLQVLWVCFLIHFFMLALSAETAEGPLQGQPDSGQLLGASTWRRIVVQVCTQVLTLTAVLFQSPQVLGIPSSVGVREWSEASHEHYSLHFHSFVLLQLASFLAARAPSKPSLSCAAVLAASLLGQLLLLEFGGSLFKVAPLSFWEHLLCLVVGGFPLCTSYLAELLPHVVLRRDGFQLRSFKFSWLLAGQANPNRDE